MLTFRVLALRKGSQTRMHQCTLRGVPFLQWYGICSKKIFTGSSVFLKHKQQQPGNHLRTWNILVKTRRSSHTSFLLHLLKDDLTTSFTGNSCPHHLIHYGSILCRVAETCRKMLKHQSTSTNYLPVHGVSHTPPKKTPKLQKLVPPSCCCVTSTDMRLRYISGRGNHASKRGS